GRWPCHAAASVAVGRSSTAGASSAALIPTPAVTWLPRAAPALDLGDGPATADGPVPTNALLSFLAGAAVAVRRRQRLTGGPLHEHRSVASDDLPGSSDGTCLLHHMRQLMGNQAPSTIGCRSESTRTKHDVPSHRIGMGVHLSRGLPGGCVGVYAHVREVVAEALLHVLLQRRLQRSARAGKDAIDTGRRDIRVGDRLAR